MNNTPGSHKNIKEFTFRWGKQFTFLTLRTLNSKIELCDGLVTIRMKKRFLGFINGGLKTFRIPADSILQVSLKRFLFLPDLLMPALYGIAGFLLNPLFFIIVPLSLWACLNSYVIIHTKDGKLFRIPCFNKYEAEEFILYINDIYLD